MSNHDSCIFCKIINKTIPAAIVYEDEHVLAFLDLSQVTKGHTLLIPKNHCKDVFELPEETAKHLFSKAPIIANAIKEAYSAEGLNLLNNNGEIAGQSVFHFHMHFIPRYGKGDGFGAVWKTHESKYTPSDYQIIASEIAKHI